MLFRNATVNAEEDISIFNAREPGRAKVASACPGELFPHDEDFPVIVMVRQLGQVKPIVAGRSLRFGIPTSGMTSFGQLIKVGFRHGSKLHGAKLLQPDQIGVLVPRGKHLLELLEL